MKEVNGKEFFERMKKQYKESTPDDLHIDYEDFGMFINLINTQEQIISVKNEIIKDLEKRI